MKIEKASIYDLRRRKRMTQKELARKVGVTERTIILYENDIEKLRSASYKNVENIAKVLGVSVSNIFLSANSEKPKNGVDKNNQPRKELEHEGTNQSNNE